MQMKMINLASVSRKKEKIPTKTDFNSLKSPHLYNKLEDLNNIIILSGTATRKQIKKAEKTNPVKPVEKLFFKQNFLKLRAPFYKSSLRQIHTEEKLVTKSCETLFECIKPYKDIRMAKKTQETQSKTIGSVLSTNTVIYERKATRKIQFMSVSEETPTEFFLWDERKTSLESLPTSFVDFNVKKVKIQNEMKSLTVNEGNAEMSQRKTVSSEDFINNVFSEAELL